MELSARTSLPTIRIPEIVAGLSDLQPGTRYDVPAQPYSAVYCCETHDTIVSMQNRQATANPGEIIAIPRGTAHSICLAGAQPSRRGDLQPPFNVETERVGAAGRTLCCRVPTSANPLPDVVPDLMVFGPDRQKGSGRLDLIFALIRHYAGNRERQRQFMLRRLAEMAAAIFLETILADIDARGVDLGRASSDPGIRRVINAVHAEPGKSWSVDEMAQIAGLSRSSFAERFRGTVGITPAAYVGNQRLDRAARLLSESDETVSRVAFEVGYETDSAFAKAFRKRFGISPSTYRRMTPREQDIR